MEGGWAQAGAGVRRMWCEGWVESLRSRRGFLAAMELGARRDLKTGWQEKGKLGMLETNNRAQPDSFMESKEKQEAVLKIRCKETSRSCWRCQWVGRIDLDPTLV